MKILGINGSHRAGKGTAGLLKIALDEAAALGAALQALYVLLAGKGQQVSFAELCKEHVKIKDDMSVLPNPANQEVYAQRYSDYQTLIGCVEKLYR